MPRIIGASLTEHREEVRRRLFDALAQLMEERGFDAISLADIAQAAGIGRTALYNHVPDKETLLIDYISEETQQYLAALETALSEVTDPVEQLRIYVRHQLRVRRSLHMPAGLRSAVSPAAQARLREHAEPVEGVLRRILTTGMASGAFAPQPLEVTVPLVSACLGARVARGQHGAHVGGPAVGHAGADEVTPAAIEAFVLRAVGAVH